MGIITNIDGSNNQLKELLQHRSISTIPFGGRYRLIDFVLSNMVHSGVRDIGVIGSHKYSSLIDHLGTGQEWSLNRKSQDLSILTGGSLTRIGDLLKINLQDIALNKNYIIDKKQEHVLICAPNIVSNFSLDQLIEKHEKTNADVTLMFKKSNCGTCIEKHDLFINIDRDHRVTKIASQDTDIPGWLFVDILIIKKDLLIEILDRATVSGEWDLMDILADNTNKLTINAFPHIGYLRKICSLTDYFNSSMELLELENIESLFLGKRPVYTKSKDNHPTKYTETAMVNNAFIASGSIIEGKIQHSIIFRESKIGEGTTIKNSVIMQKGDIGKNVYLDYVIFDKDVSISDGTVLIGKSDKPIILKKGTVI
jgi:glucose-1-phosphate adenylyltransferase